MCVEFILYFLLFCSVLVYQEYNNANINPWRVETLNIFPTTKHSNTTMDIPMFEQNLPSEIFFIDGGHFYNHFNVELSKIPKKLFFF